MSSSGRQLTYFICVLSSGQIKPIIPHRNHTLSKEGLLHLEKRMSTHVWLRFAIGQFYVFQRTRAEPYIPVGSIQDLRRGARWFDPRARLIFFPRIDDCHCDRIHSSLTAVRCYSNYYVGKQPVAWKNIVPRTGKKNPGKYGLVHWPQQYTCN